VLCAAALLGCWMVWRPLHSVQLVNRAENTGDLATAQAARSADPLALIPNELLSSLYLTDHDAARAQAALERNVRTQPQNPNAWAPLAEFFITRHQWRDAVVPLHQVQVLDQTTDVTTGINNQRIVETFKHLPGS
jgi:hypothetical protein